VCRRLNLVSLAYLWSLDQTDLLNEMIDSGIDAILIKVACIGLDPRKHLGKSLVEMRPYLMTLKDENAMNVCGEGGEYESLTLNCRLFKKRIVVDDTQLVIHSNDAFATVGYLKIKKFHLEEK